MELDVNRLAAAKLWLISEPPPHSLDLPPRNLSYLSHALYALIAVSEPEVPRISVDEWGRIYVNPEWLIGATVADIGAELAHVTWHLLLDHTNRARDLHVDASVAHHWGAAADTALLALLYEADLPAPVLQRSSELAYYGVRSAEEYYAALSGLPVREELSSLALGPTDGCGSGCDGVRRTHELPPHADIGALPPEELAEIRRRVAIAYVEGSKTAGDKPGHAARWASEVLDPIVAWEPLLAKACRRAVGWASGRGDYTYSRPSRRASSVPSVVLPGLRRPVPRVAVVVDTSASVDDALLGRALAEIDGVLRALGVDDGQVAVYSCDAAVHAVARVRRARDLQLAGAGGTDLRIGLAMAAAKRPRPQVIIALTDGFTPWPDAAPPGAVVVIGVLGRRGSPLPPTPSWATRIECLLH